MKQAGQPAAEHQVLHRGRGRSRQRAPRRLRPRRTSRSSPPTSSSSPTRRCSIAASRRSATACAASTYFQIDLRGTQERPALRIVRRRRRESGVRARADPRADEGPQRPHQDSRASTTTCGALSEAERAEWKKLPFNETQVPQGARRAEAVRRERLLDARARVGAADVRGERPAVRLHRRGREDRAAGRRDGQGQHAPRARSGSGQDRASCSRPT